MSSDCRAAPRYATSRAAMSSAAWPPSVRVTSSTIAETLAIERALERRVEHAPHVGRRERLREEGIRPRAGDRAPRGHRAAADEDHVRPQTPGIAGRRRADARCGLVEEDVDVRGVLAD